MLSGDTQGRPDPGEEGGKLREGSGEGAQGHHAAWHMEGWQGPGAGVKSLNTVPKASKLSVACRVVYSVVYVCLQEIVGFPRSHCLHLDKSMALAAHTQSIPDWQIPIPPAGLPAAPHTT